MIDVFSDLSSTYEPHELSYIREALAGQERALTPELIEAAAHEILHYQRQGTPANELAGRAGLILVRAWSRVRAQIPRPMHSGRKPMTRDDVSVASRAIPYQGFFALEETTLRHTRYHGGMSEQMSRTGFLMADAVTVVPYDPVRDRVLVIEQFRYGPFGRGDLHPWTLEPVAGRIDVGEGAESTARREALEEAGVTLGELHLVAGYYPSGGAVTEHVTSYVGIADLPDGVTGIGGLDAEHEDIASMLFAYDEFIDMCDRGQLDTGPLFLTALWLARHRDRLRDGLVS